jgi:hypothetical protein
MLAVDEYTLVEAARFTELHLVLQRSMNQEILDQAQKLRAAE